MDKVAEADLDAMQARADAATAGPWWSCVEGRDGTSGDTFIGRGLPEARQPDLYLSSDPGQHVSAEDHDFVAAARQDVPRLIAEVRRLRRLLEGDGRTTRDLPVPEG